MADEWADRMARLIEPLRVEAWLEGDPGEGLRPWV